MCFHDAPEPDRISIDSELIVLVKTSFARSRFQDLPCHDMRDYSAGGYAKKKE